MERIGYTPRSRYFECYTYRVVFNMVVVCTRSGGNSIGEANYWPTNFSPVLLSARRFAGDYIFTRGRQSCICNLRRWRRQSEAGSLVGSVCCNMRDMIGFYHGFYAPAVRDSECGTHGAASNMAAGSTEQQSGAAGAAMKSPTICYLVADLISLGCCARCWGAPRRMILRGGGGGAQWGSTGERG